MNENVTVFYTVSGVAILIFVLLSAFFSSAEIAFAKCNRIRFQRLAEEGDKTAKLVNKISNNYVDTLSAILVGNNLVNIAASSLATAVATMLLGKAKGETVSTVAMTAVILLFGETLPKIIASAVPDITARIYCRPLLACMFVFRPVVFGVNRFVKLLSPIWTPKEKAPEITGDELCEILEDIEEEGVFTEDESELIKSAIEFTDTTAKDVLTPRVDIFAIDIDDGFDLTDEMYTHSRIPVYRGSIDNIIGILPTKQLMKNIAMGMEPDIEALLYEPIFVHMTRTVSSIVEEFRKKHRQMAVVVDEFGGTMGILTLEDITEELVGDIFDERDRREDEMTLLEDGTYKVDGGMNIYDMFDEVDFDEPADFDTEYTTVGGWATEMLDRFPVPGDSFTFENLKLTVTEATSVRVLCLTLEILETAKPDED